MPYKTPANRRAAEKRYRERNRDKERARGRRWRQENPEYTLLKSAQEAAKKHGYAPPSITLEELSRLLESRGEICPICGLNPAGHLDHDHVTGKVRGWLCNNCNSGLGFFADDVARLRRAEGYIQCHQ